LCFISSLPQLGWDCFVVVVGYPDHCLLSPQNLAEQIDVQVAHQQISSTYNGLASGASSENVSGELNPQQNTRAPW
jgi:hypothetical protein